MQLSKRFKDIVFPPRGNLVRMRFREREAVEALVPDDERFGLARELVLQRVYDGLGGFPAGTVIDAGAHVGLFSLVAAQHAEHVIALEPDPVNFRVLQLNLALNKATNVTPINAALWTEPGEIPFQTSWHTTGGRILNSGDEVVETRTLDQLIGEYGEVDLLKLDVEGAENKVIPAAEEALRSVKRIVAELHYYEEAERQAIVTALEKGGFDVSVTPAPELYRAREAAKVARNWRRLDGQTWIKLGAIGYFLAPVDKPRRPAGSREMPLLAAERR